MLKGTLSLAAAKRIKQPDLANTEVEYTWLRPGMAGEVYHDGVLIGKCIEIGSDGIIPLQEERQDE